MCGEQTEVEPVSGRFLRRAAWRDTLMARLGTWALWGGGMAIEIECKFLVTSEDWRPHVVERNHLRQAYLARPGKTSIQLRILDEIQPS